MIDSCTTLCAVEDPQVIRFEKMATYEVRRIFTLAAQYHQSMFPLAWAAITTEQHGWAIEGHWSAGTGSLWTQSDAARARNSSLLYNGQPVTESSCDRFRALYVESLSLDGLPTS